MNLEQMRALHAKDPANYGNPDNCTVNHTGDAKPIPFTNFYGATVPAAWYQLLHLSAGMGKMKVQSMVKEAVEAIASPDEQLVMANNEGVTRSHIVRRLIKEAFPWLPEWNYEMYKRKAMKNTPKAPSMVKAKEETDAKILQRAATESRQVFSPEVYAELVELARMKDMSPDEYIKAMITKHVEKYMEK